MQPKHLQKLHWVRWFPICFDSKYYKTVGTKSVLLKKSKKIIKDMPSWHNNKLNITNEA